MADGHCSHQKHIKVIWIIGIFFKNKTPQVNIDHCPLVLVVPILPSSRVARQTTCRADEGGRGSNLLFVARPQRPCIRTPLRRPLCNTDLSSQRLSSSPQWRRIHRSAQLHLPCMLTIRRGNSKNRRQKKQHTRNQRRAYQLIK